MPFSLRKGFLLIARIRTHKFRISDQDRIPPKPDSKGGIYSSLRLPMFVTSCNACSAALLSIISEVFACSASL